VRRGDLASPWTELSKAPGAGGSRGAAHTGPVTEIPDELAPAPGEMAVLSLLAADQAGEWTAVCGSLLSVPCSVAYGGWPRWASRQPSTRPRREREWGADLGPNFCVDPFPGLRAVRAVIEPTDWWGTVSALVEGTISTLTIRAGVPVKDWSSRVLLCQHGLTEAHQAVWGAKRPIVGVAAELEPRPLPHSESLWRWALPPHVPPGRALGETAAHRRFSSWPTHLLGIDWPGGNDSAPPTSFVVGRLQHEAWIADVEVDHTTDELTVHIAWDEHRIDPLGCSMWLRTEKRGLPLVARHLRIADLPEREDPAGAPDEGSRPVEPRTLGWEERTLAIGVPRGAPRTEWGISLLAPEGRLLDERPLVARFEQVSFSMYVDGSSEPFSTAVVGDRRAPPAPHERDSAITAAHRVEHEARTAAARRRISTSGELKDYLRWRFSARAGELLILDPYLIHQDRPAAVSFLTALDRRVRALARSIPAADRAPLQKAPGIEVRALPGGSGDLHDRIWLVGECGLQVGTSVGNFLASARSVGR